MGLQRAIVRSAGALARRRYSGRLVALAGEPVHPPRFLDADVVAFSGPAQLPEQVASLRSFLRYVGRPASYTVVSDRVLAERDVDLLAALDRSVHVRFWTEFTGHALPPAVRAMAAGSAMGIKLAVEISMPVRRPTLYIDSDVLFHPAAGEIARLVADPPAPALHLVDPEDVYLDHRLLRQDEIDPPVNAGFFLLADSLRWTEALGRLATLGGEPTFHTEQTLVHLAMRASGAKPLDPDRYVVATDDMRRLRDRHRGHAVVLRHYTTPVRPKMWLAVSRERRRPAPAAPAHG
jgi:hypothetical protein